MTFVTGLLSAIGLVKQRDAELNSPAMQNNKKAGLDQTEHEKHIKDVATGSLADNQRDLAE